MEICHKRTNFYKDNKLVRKFDAKCVIIRLFNTVKRENLIDIMKGYSSMNENIESSQKFPMRPVAPLGVIAMNGCEEMGRRVNEYLMNWQVDATSDQKLHSFYGSDKNGFLLEGVLRANAVKGGRVADMCMYSLLSPALGGGKGE